MFRERPYDGRSIGIGVGELLFCMFVESTVVRFAWWVTFLALACLLAQPPAFAF